MEALNEGEYRRRIVFTIQHISVLLMFMPDANLSTCVQADWQASLDRANWSTCPKTNTYLRGLWRHQHIPGDERVGRIEFGWCCPASEPSYANQTATCSNANWLNTLDGWVIREIDQKQKIIKGNGKIALQNRNLSRRNEVIRRKRSSFKRATVNAVHLIFIVGGLNIRIIWSCANFCFAVTKVINFLWRYLNIIFQVFQIPNNNFFPLEYNFVVNDIFLRKGSSSFSLSVWALCPSGYYLNGLRLSAGLPAYLYDIDEGQCCHPQNHPNSYEQCYDEDVTLSFDFRGWSTCKQQGYYMTGFYKSNCNDIHCIEKFKCCKMKNGIAINYYSLSNLK